MAVPCLLAISIVNQIKTNLQEGVVQTLQRVSAN